MRIQDFYTLKYVTKPDIQNGQIVQDPGVGGIKIVYWKRRMMMKEFHKGLIKFSYPVKIYKRTKVVFLRPYKKNWDTLRNRLAHNYWGKKNNPLTNMWIVVNKDYKKWSGIAVRFEDQIVDHNIIKALKSEQESFIITNQNQFFK